MKNCISFLPNLRQQFCERYWKKTPKLPKRNYVELESALYNVNLRLLTGTGPSSQEFLRRYELPFSKIIALTDKEFKTLNKTKKEMTVYRGIAEPYDSQNPLLKKMYQDSLKLSKNDIMVSKGYLFASIGRHLAELFGLFSNKKGILYEINVPKGAKISQRWDEVIFSRYSKFKCVETKEINDENGQYTLKKLEYILPNKKLSFFSL